MTHLKFINIKRNEDRIAAIFFHLDYLANRFLIYVIIIHFMSHGVVVFANDVFSRMSIT